MRSSNVRGLIFHYIFSCTFQDPRTGTLLAARAYARLWADLAKKGADVDVIVVR